MSVSKHTVYLINVTSRTLCRSTNGNPPILQRCLSTSVKEHIEPTFHHPSIENSALGDFRTCENNPVHHTTQHAGQFYTILPEIKVQLFQNGGFPKLFEKQIKTFGETCLMVRNPALEVLHYLKIADYSRPAIRYVLFGQPGCGKSLTLAHVVNFGLMAGFLLVHVPWVANWTRRPREVSSSTTREGFVDLPLDAATWLVHFKSQNSALLNKLDLRISKDYIWSKRETTREGSSILELVEHGINRVKYASDCIIALLKEIKTHSTHERCKTLVAIDGFNSFFYPKTRVVNESKVIIHPSKITLTEAFIEITKFDWSNGAVVVTVDQIAASDDRQASVLPLYQLGKEGFEHMDPFVPIRVSEYNAKEIESCLQYYIDRRWIQNPNLRTEDGRKELGFLSGNNPYHLMNMCTPL